MAVTLKDTLDSIYAVMDGLQDGSETDYFDHLSIGKPLSISATTGEITGVITIDSYGYPDEMTPVSTLGSTVERRTVKVDAYRKVDGSADSEYLLDEIMAKLQEALLDDFDLGGDVRNIDAARIAVTFGYETIGEDEFRLASMALPLVVDDNATFTE